MKTSNTISLSLTGLTVKLYMQVAIVWSKGYAFYKAHQIKAPVTTGIPLTSSR